MTRTRRVLNDQNTFQTSGIQWTFREASSDDGDSAQDPATDYKAYALPFFAGNISTTLNVWGLGVVSFDNVTLAQQHFMTAASAITNFSLFPGRFVSVSAGSTFSDYAISYGVRDFEPRFNPDPFNLSPAPPTFDLGDAIDVAYITWSNNTIFASTPPTLYLTGSGLQSLQGYVSNLGEIAYPTDAGPVPVRNGDGVNNTLLANSLIASDYQAATIVKRSFVLNGQGAAVSLDGAFDFRPDANTQDATLVPHATVRAEWSGQAEWYRFTVAPGGGTAIFDIDAGLGIDTVISIHDSAFVLVPGAFNDDVPLTTPLDPGSASRLDSYLSYTFAQGGTYYLKVDKFTGSTPGPDASYVLNVSLPRAILTAPTIAGGVANFGIDGGVVNGLGGDDFLIGSAGDDVLDGGIGTDVASFQDSSADVLADLVWGEAHGHGDDLLIAIEGLTGGSGNDTLRGNDSANMLNGGGGADIILGRGGADVLRGGNGNDNMAGADGDDQMFGDGDNDTLAGGFGLDMLNGGSGDDLLFGEGDNDTLTGGAGNDLTNGGAGTDLLLFTAAPNRIVLDLGRATPQDTGEGVDTIVSIENVIATAFDDLITGGLTSGIGHVISGGGGNDIIFGLGADDIFDGGDGNDQLFGGAGNDQLYGGNNDDSILAGLGNDLVAGGAGTDLMSFLDATARIMLDLGRTTAQDTGQGIDTISGIENVIGSNFNDLITAGLASGNGNVISGAGGGDIIFGLGANDLFDGGDGDDWLIGNGGADILFGGADADLLDGGAGDDYLDGGTGNDTVTFAGAGARIVVNLATAAAQNTEQGTDTILNIENVTGTGFADLISGNGGPNILTGGAGADILFGGSGNDDYRYLASSDSTSAARDLIAGFATGDRIDLSAIDANPVLAGDNAFSFIGAAAFSNVAGQLRVTGSGTSWLVQGDIDGNGVADFEINVASEAPGYVWGAVDFVL